MSAGELINAIGLSIYEPPLVNTKLDHKRRVSELGVVALFIDFDTEVQMGGVLSFLENSTGLYLDQTVTALDRIGAHSAAAIMTDVRLIMRELGITPEHLRGDLSGVEEFSITTFSQTHGKEATEMVGKIAEATGNLFIYDGGKEDPYALLQEFVSENLGTIKTQLTAATA